MSSAFDSDELLHLCADLADGALHDAQAEKLRALIAADDRAIEFYLRFMEVHAFLDLDYATGTTATAMPGIAAMPSASLSGQAGAVGLFAPAVAPVRSSRWRSVVRRSGRSGLPFAAGFAAAVLLIGLFAMRAPREKERVITSLTSPARPVPREAPGADRKLGIARVIKLDDARGSTGAGQPPTVGQFVSPGRFQLQSGAATLAFLSGVVLSLEGPADLDLISMDRVFCRYGRLRARIPKEADGFVIASHKSAEFHFGTDFALNVEPDGRTRVMVFEGVAEVALLDADGEPTRSQVIAKRKVFDLNPATGRIDETHAETDSFLSGSLGPTAPLVLDADYAATVLASRPIGYWRFERREKRAFLNEVPGAPALHVHGPIRSEGEAGANGYAVFPAGRTDSFLETENYLWNLRRTPGYAVECWFLSDRYSHDMLFGLFPPRTLNPPGNANRYLHAFSAELMTWQRMPLGKPGSVRMVHRSPADWELLFNVYSDNLYVPKRWHHLVAQRRGEWAELYLDGHLNRREVLDSNDSSLNCQLVVGRRTNDPENQVDPRAFAGCLDELAIYDHVLTSAEVQRRYQAATSR